MVLTNLAGLIVFMTGLFIMFLVVPLKQVIKLVPRGLVGGFGVALLLIYLMQNIFGLWIFRSVDFVYISRIPLFLALGWVPCIITFSYLIEKYVQLPIRAGFLLAFPLSGTIVHYLLTINKMLVYHNWNLILTFLVSIAIHSGIIRYLYISGQLEKSASNI